MTDPRAVPVMILNFNGWEDTLETIGRIAPYTKEVWLIDNGSAVDRSVEVKALHPEVRLLQTGSNLGWAGGYNFAIATARAEGYRRTYLLNNDAVLHPGALEAAVAAMESGGNDIAAVASIILRADDNSIFFDGNYVLGRDKEIDDIDPGVQAVSVVNGAGFLLNLAAIDAVGPFCEDFFLYHEETDWSVIAVRAGWRILIAGTSIVSHKLSSSDVNHNAAYYGPRNRFLMVKRGTAPWPHCTTRKGAIANIISNIERLPRAAHAAVAQALIDGLAGRYGKRGKGMPAPILHGVAALIRAASKVRKLSRRKRS